MPKERSIEGMNNRWIESQGDESSASLRQSLSGYESQLTGLFHDETKRHVRLAVIL